MKKRWTLILCACLFPLMIWLFVICPANPTANDLKPFSNQEQVIASIRQGLRDHAKNITVSFSCPAQNNNYIIREDLIAMAGDWIQEAMKETDNETEGDYIYYQYGGYKISCSRFPNAQDGRYVYTVRITPRYYTYLAQEETVSEKLNEIFDTFAFSNSDSDYKKALAIYNYICQNVKYDEVHRKNIHYHLKSTAYAALIQGAAGCQGYCVTLYRMFRRAGIPCRIVTGMGYGERGAEFHAWNIARVDGLWYCLDATWDAGKLESQYNWFLRGSARFDRHVPGDAFSDWDMAYPLSQEDYGDFLSMKS